MIRTKNKLLSFRVDGSPVPKQSFQMGANGHGFTKEAVLSWSEYVATAGNIAMREQLQRYNQPLTHGFLGVDLLFVLDYNRRVDCDNLSKCVLDAMQGVIYENDYMIVDLYACKFWNIPTIFPGVDPKRKFDSPGLVINAPAGVDIKIYRVEV